MSSTSSVDIGGFLLYIGVWCNGSMSVSKTVGQGSSPCTPVKNKYGMVLKWLKRVVCKTIIGEISARQFESDPYLLYGVLAKW